MIEKKTSEKKTGTKSQTKKEMDWFQQALLYRQQGNIDDALDAFEEAFQQNPKNKDLIYEYAITYEDTGNLDKAINLFQKLIDIEPKDPTSWFYLCESFLLKEDYKSAFNTAQKVLELNEHHPAAWLDLGIAKHHLDDFDGAIDAYEKAIRLDPSFHKSWLNLGEAKRKKNDLLGAIKCAEKALILTEEQKDKQGMGIILYNIACYYALLNNKEKALDMFIQAVENDSINIFYAKTDKDLDILRNEPKFLELIKEEKRE